MTHKNTHDRQRENRMLNNQKRFEISLNVGEVRRKDRQLMRQWAVTGRTAFGVNSIAGYCLYVVHNGLIDLH